MSTARPMDRGFALYFVRLVLGCAAAFAAVLGLTVLVIALVEPSGLAALLIALVGVASALGSVAVVSKRLTSRWLANPGAGEK